MNNNDCFKGNSDLFHLPADVQKIELSFVSLDFTNPKKNNYRYRLYSKIKSPWIDLHGENTLLFDRMKSNSYTLEIQGSNHAGLWSPQVMQFRFTITSINWWILKEYEPGAPELVERINSLIYAFRKGYKTSVSIEPFLDMNPIALIYLVAPYVTESIWLGKLNYMKREFNTWDNIKEIIERVELLPEEIRSKIKYKDSIRILIKKHGEI